MENKKYLFAIFILLLNVDIVLSQQACSTNLECKETGCCHKDICTEASECKKINHLCYIFVGVGAFVIIVIITIYFIRKIRETKKHLEYLKKTDPGSLSRLNREKKQ